jgi:hypothetical protein
MLHQSLLVRKFVLRSVLFSRARSPVGGNVVVLPVAIPFLLSERHIGANRFAACETSCGGIFYADSISAANFMKELMNLGERTSLFSPDPSFLMQPEISDIIYYIVTG